MTDEQQSLYFDAEKQKKAIDWINQKCGDLKCECCGTKQWQLAPEITAPPTYKGGLMLGGNVMPMFSIVCANCGNTKLFNALVTGVLPRMPEEKKEAENGN